MWGQIPGYQHSSRPFSFSNTLDPLHSSGSLRTAERAMGVARGSPSPRSLSAVLPTPGGGWEKHKGHLAHPQSPGEVTGDEGDGRMFPHAVWGLMTPGAWNCWAQSGFLCRRQEQSASCTSLAIPPPSPCFPGPNTQPLATRARSRQQSSLRTLLLSPGGMSLISPGSC